MSLEKFPAEKLIPAKAFVSKRGERFDIGIALQPFELDGETVETDFRLDGVRLPETGPSTWAGQSYTFPVNPEEGYIDGSIYLRCSHNPTDVTKISFGSVHGDVIDAEFAITLVFEFEGIGFENTAVRITVPVDITKA
jgi:hypothetical protein